jgi:hypothetical protein
MIARIDYSCQAPFAPAPNDDNHKPIGTSGQRLSSAQKSGMLASQLSSL